MPLIVSPVPKLIVPMLLPGARVLPALMVTAGVIVPVPLSVPPLPVKLMLLESAVLELYLNSPAPIFTPLVLLMAPPDEICNVPLLMAVAPE